MCYTEKCTGKNVNKSRQKKHLRVLQSKGDNSCQKSNLQKAKVQVSMQVGDLQVPMHHLATSVEQLQCFVVVFQAGWELQLHVSAETYWKNGMGKNKEIKSINKEATATDKT